MVIKPKRRIAIYVYHNVLNKVSNYALYYLSSLKEITDEIIVVLNGKFDEKEKEKLYNLNLAVLERENKGYDFFGYRKGILSISNDKLSKCDELILCNSSTFGPLFPFKNLFDEMQKKECDFWGITKHPSIKQNVIRFNFETKIKEHIQSYFLVFRKSMFLDPRFKNYFENLKKIKNKKEAIGFLEVNFTEYFKNLGFKYSVFAPDEVLEFGIDNYHQYLSNIMAEKYKVPLIKKTAFGERYDLNLKESYPNKTEELFNYIKNETKYDINLITNEIASIYSTDEVKKFLHLNFVLSDKTREKFQTQKSAFIFNYINDEYFEIIKTYLEGAFGLIDIYAINKNNLYKKDKLKINLLDNNTSYFKQIKELSRKYSAICMFLPEEKDFFGLNKIQKIDYLKYLLNSLIKNRIYINNIITTFEKNPYIGVLFPLIYLNKPSIQIKKNDILDFMKKMDINLKINPKYLNLLHNAFWIKTESIGKINDVIDFEQDNNLNKGIIFSLLNQKYGFLEGNVSSIDEIKIYSDNLEYLLMNQNKFFSKIASKINKIIK